MSLLADFETIILDGVYIAISNAMPQVGQELKEAIDEKASGIDGPYSRPALFGRGTYSVFNDALSATVWNRTQMQGTDYGIPEVEFVEEGYPEYNMPGPRPFMEPARDEFVASGRPEAIIQEAINSAGLGF